MSPPKRKKSSRDRSHKKRVDPPRLILPQKSDLPKIQGKASSPLRSDIMKKRSASAHRRWHSEILAGQSQRSYSKDFRECERRSSPCWSSSRFLKYSPAQQSGLGESYGKSDHRRASPYQDVGPAQNRSQHQWPSPYLKLSPAPSTGITPDWNQLASPALQYS